MKFKVLKGLDTALCLTFFTHLSGLYMDLFLDVKVLQPSEQFGHLEMFGSKVSS